MNISEILEYRTKDNYLDLPEVFFQDTSVEKAEQIAEVLSGEEFVKLPEQEIAFYEWLKVNDYDIWNDLWGDDTIKKPYIVSAIYIPLLVYSAERGFPICDLMENDNYYFTSHHLINEESKVYLETGQKMLLDKEPLSLSQLFILEVSMQPTDIWHFAYKYKLNIQDVKDEVNRLSNENAIIHITEASYLISFIDF